MIKKVKRGIIADYMFFNITKSFNSFVESFKKYRKSVIRVGVVKTDIISESMFSRKNKRLILNDP